MKVVPLPRNMSFRNGRYWLLVWSVQERGYVVKNRGAGLKVCNNAAKGVDVILALQWTCHMHAKSFHHSRLDFSVFGQEERLYAMSCACFV